MPAAHCVSSMTGIILDFDEGFCQLVQRRPDQLTGISYKTITAPGDISKSSKMLAGLINKASPTHLRKAYVRPDGSIIKADLLVSKFGDEGRLITTLFWIEGIQESSPARLWKAALRVKHVYDARLVEFGKDLFGDHVGLILLHVYLAEAEGRVVTAWEIADVVGLSEQSVERWVKALVQRGLIEMLDHTSGSIQLSQDGTIRLERLLSATLAPKSLLVG
jgi:hypothetical protein